MSQALYWGWETVANVLVACSCLSSPSGKAKLLRQGTWTALLVTLDCRLDWVEQCLSKAHLCVYEKEVL